MIKKILLAICIVVSAAFLWLLFAPVSVTPVSWKAPDNPGYTGPYTANDKLARVERIPLPEGYTGPEDFEFGPDGKLYIAVKEGAIVTYDPKAGETAVFAKTDGRPLGLAFGPGGRLYVADAFRGLLAISPDGVIDVLVKHIPNGGPVAYANDVVVTSTGAVFFTDSSTKFGAAEYGGTLEASILDLVEHGAHGRLLEYDPAQAETRLVAEGLHFPNGIALNKDETALLVAETGSYELLSLPLFEDRVAAPQPFLKNLPGFPDNINANADGTFWVGLTSPRNDLMDSLSDYPLQRKMIMRLPAFMKPKPTRYGFVLRVGEDGSVLETLQDPSGGYALTTGALTGPDGGVYISSLTEPDLGYLAPKQ